jgi:hypothetical protein
MAQNGDARQETRPNPELVGAPSGDDISASAYARFVARGQEHGGDVDDWLAAEQELRLRTASIGSTEPTDT